MHDNASNNKYDRQDITEVFAEIWEELYTSTTKTHEHEHEVKYEQHQDTMEPFTMEELNDAVNQLNRAKLQTREESMLRTTSAQQSHQPLRATTTKLTRHDDHDSTQEREPIITIDPSVRSHILYSSPSSSSSVHSPRWTPTSPLTKQASNQAMPRRKSPTHVPATQTESRRVSPAALGRSHRLQEGIRHSGAQLRM